MSTGSRLENITSEPTRLAWISSCVASSS